MRRNRDGSYELRLPEEERRVLRTLPEQLRALLTSDDPSLRRLFPPAYTEDEERETEYQLLMREDLLERKRATLEVLEATVDRSRVDEEELFSWLGAINDLRLVLGTQLDVRDDPDWEPPDDSPDAPAFALYAYLGWLQEQIVAALDPDYR